VPPDTELELRVVCSYRNLPEKYAIAPKFSKKKTFAWWVALGDLEVDELVSIKRIMMPAKQGLARSSVFNFSTPAEEIGETFTLSVLVLSDSYFGLDQQYDIEITTIEDENKAAESATEDGEERSGGADDYDEEEEEEDEYDDDY
jgi:preprotein translocase subunit Sec63